MTAPAAVRAAWGWDDDHAVEPLSGGLMAVGGDYLIAPGAVRRGVAAVRGP